MLVNDADGLAAASAAAEQVHRGSSGARVAVVPSKAVVQGIAALAVHEPGRRFDADVRESRFPDAEHSFPMKDSERAALEESFKPKKVG